MIGVLTGDIINSRKVPPQRWLPVLKKTLSFHGKHPSAWEIFRGDSFQIQTDAEQALLVALHLKAAIKEIRELDVRIGIGTGAVDFRGKKISESNGPAFVRSGECFEGLKKQNLAVKTGTILDQPLNLMLALALLTMDGWTATVASAVRVSLENPHRNQKEIADLLGKSQSSVSEALTRGGFEEVSLMQDYYQKEIATI